MKFYSSTFLSIIISFLVFLSTEQKPIEVVSNPIVPDFTTIFEEESDTNFEGIQIEIFDDLNCRQCTEFILETLPKIKNLEQETDEIDLRLYFIPNVNVEADYLAALSLKCASDQDAFWGMHEKLHRFEENLIRQSLTQFSNELELNTDAFNECLKENVHQKEVEEDIKYAAEKGITIKPTILINQYRLVGNQPFENIQRIINKILKKKVVEELPPAIPIKPTSLEPELEFGSGIEVPENPEILEINALSNE